MILRLHGSSTRNVNQYSYKIEPYSIQLINPGSLFSFDDISDSAKSFVLLFDNDFIWANNELFSFHKDNEQNIQLEVNLFSKVLDIYEQINTEFKIKDHGYIDFIKIYINQLLYILKREKEKQQSSIDFTQAQKLSSKYLSLIEENFKELKKVSDYAKLLEVTPNHLSQTIKEIFKNNALSYINKRIIREIEYLLSDEKKSIKSIASELNFDSHSQMSRFYKHNSAQTPKEFRITLLQT